MFSQSSLDMENESTTFPPALVKNSDAIPLPTFIPRRYQPGSLANWSGHLAFANDLIAEIKPTLLVELGTHYGESYFGMCQSVLGNGVDCVCYAVDHWLGEEHAEKYGEEVFTEVNDYNNRNYKPFSYLLRTSFDDALSQFSDNSIDLLHIDGLHTFEAGSHDFMGWFPKVKPGGIILIHDVMVRHANFGIWKLWEELEATSPETFTFHHSWGLGVLRKPGGEVSADLLDLLFSSSGEVSERVRRHYVLYSAYLDRLLCDSVDAPEPQQLLEESPPAVSSHIVTETTYFQIFPFVDQNYSESASFECELLPGEWTTLQFDLPHGLMGPLRLDPANRPCVLQFNYIRIIDCNSELSVWTAQTPAMFKGLKQTKSIVFLRQHECALMLSCSADPQMFLPPIQHAGPVRLEISVRLEADLEMVTQALTLVGEEIALPETSDPVMQDATLANPVAVQVYPYSSTGYREADSIQVNNEAGQWNTSVFNLEAASFSGPIRIDPANICCLVEIESLLITAAVTDEVIVHLREAGELKRYLAIVDSAIYLPCDDRCLLFCYGNDSKLQVSPPTEFQGAVQLQLSTRVQLELNVVAALLIAGAELSISPEQAKLSAEVDSLRAELKALQLSRIMLSAEISQLVAAKNTAIRDKELEFRTSKERLSQLRKDLEASNQIQKEAIASRDEALSKVNEALLETELSRQARNAALHSVDRTLLEKEELSAALQRSLVDIQIAINDKSDALKKLQAAIEIQRAESMAKTEALEKLRTAIDERNTASIGKSEALAELTAAFAERDQLKQSVERSLSWRATRPLRNVMAFLRSKHRAYGSGPDIG